MDAAANCTQNVQANVTILDVPSSSLCPHGKRLNRCTACSKYSCQIPGCPKEGHRFAGAYVLMRHMRNCHITEVRALTKRKELEVHQLLELHGIDFRYQHYLPFKTCGLEGNLAVTLISALICPGERYYWRWTRTNTSPTPQSVMW